jgi:hypothetical protein
VSNEGSVFDTAPSNYEQEYRVAEYAYETGYDEIRCIHIPDGRCDLRVNKLKRLPMVGEEQIFDPGFFLMVV